MIYGTIKRGKVKITSPKQIRWLEWMDLPYTYYKHIDGIKKVRRNVK